VQNDWLGKLAFQSYWRVLEEYCPGVVKGPKFSHVSLAEREAWVEAARAVAEQLRDSSLISSSK
jgi:hypothetical protein